MDIDLSRIYTLIIAEFQKLKEEANIYSPKLDLYFDKNRTKITKENIRVEQKDEISKTDLYVNTVLKLIPDEGEYYSKFLLNVTRYIFLLENCSPGILEDALYLLDFFDKNDGVDAFNKIFDNLTAKTKEEIDEILPEHIKKIVNDMDEADREEFYACLIETGENHINYKINYYLLMRNYLEYKPEVIKGLEGVIAIYRYKSDKESKEKLMNIVEENERYFKKYRKENNAIRNHAVDEYKKYITVGEFLSKIENEDEIINYDIVKKIENEEIKNKILLYINKKNQKVINKLELEYQNKVKNSLLNYQSFLSKKNLSSIDAKKIMNNPIEDVEKIIIKLSNYKINDATIIKNILSKTNIETFNEICNLIDSNVISKNIIEINQRIFDKKSTEYKNLIENLRNIEQFKTTKNNKLNPHNFENNLEVLLSDPDVLKQNLEFIYKNELNLSMNKEKNCKFLTYENLEEILKIADDLGILNLVKEDMDILNYCDKFDRIRILNILDEPIPNSEYLIKILSSSNFLVSDYKIKDYLDLENYNDDKAMKQL